MPFSLTARTADLLSALKRVQGAVARNTSLPILGNVLLTGHADSGLDVAGTDLDLWIETGCDAEVLEDGAVTLPARRLLAIVGAAPERTTSIEVDRRNYATVRSGEYIAVLQGLPADEFPKEPHGSEERKSWQVSEIALKDAFTKTLYAISADETRYVLTGPCFEFDGGELAVVATDGRRLARACVPITRAAKGKWILPGRAATALSALLGDDGEVEISTCAHLARFAVGDSVIVSKLIDGNFPAYRSVLPGSPRSAVKVERQPFLAALKRVGFLSADGSPTHLEIEREAMTLRAKAPDVGEARMKIPARWSGKGKLLLAANGKYLEQPLEALAVDEVAIDIVDEFSAIVLRHGAAFIYVAMPMRPSMESEVAA